MTRLIPALAILTVAALGIGCTQQHVANAPVSHDLRQPIAGVEHRSDVPRHIRGIGAADAAGAVLWDRDATATAYLVRPGLPDVVMVYDERSIEPQTIASVPTP